MKNPRRIVTGSFLFLWGRQAGAGVKISASEPQFPDLRGFQRFPGTPKAGSGPVSQNPGVGGCLGRSFSQDLQGNLRLQENSAAVDAGNNEFVEGVPTDIDGQPRIVRGRVDLGAYETLIDLIFRDRWKLD